MKRQPSKSCVVRIPKGLCASYWMLMLMMILGFGVGFAPDSLASAFSWNSGTRFSRCSCRFTRRDLYELGRRTRTRTRTRTTPKTSTGNNSCCRKSLSSSLTMRDRSASYWFSVGDTVTVVQDVFRSIGGAPTPTPARENLKGRIGSVVQTWEKCDVDPTCCCAEQVDTDLAVRVAFRDIDDNADTDMDAVDIAKNTPPPKPPDGSTAFYYYFAEDELVKV